MHPSTRRVLLIISVACVATLGVSFDVLAQESSLVGTVQDPEGQPLPGVQVMIVNEETGLRRSAVTDVQGRFQFPSLPIGTYTIRTTLSGFQPVEQQGVRLRLGQQASLGFELQLADIEEAITVTAAAPVVDVSASEVAANVSQEQIDKLPIKGRQWIDLGTILPQTGQDAIRAVFYNSVNIGAGVNFYSNGFYVDGVSNNWQQQGEPRQDFPQDGIAEFRVHQANATARYGFAQGGYLSTVTKSGTNSFHGSIYEYYRDEALNSRTIFQDEKPSYQRNQFGGSLGGPIVEDEMFFFGSLEYTDETQFFTVNTGGAFPEEEGTFDRPYYNYMLLGRVDHTINENHRYFVRYARQDNEREFVGAGGTRASSASFTFAAPRDSFVFGETWVVSDDSFNDFRFQLAKATYIGWPSVPGLRWTDPGEFPQERLDSIPPIFNRPSLTTGNQSSFLGPERHLQIVDTFSHYTGNHDLRFGADLTWILWQPDNVGISPVWFFDTDRPFDPDDPSTHPFLFQQRLLPIYNDFPSTEHSLFFSDDWRVADNLTVNLGVRYDWQTQVWNEDLLEREQPALIVAGETLREEGVPDPSLFPFYDNSDRGDWNNIAPRLGMVWDPQGNGRQVVRAAYGLYYNRYRANGEPRAERNPRELFVVIQNPSFPDPYEGQDPFEFAAENSSFTIQGNENRTPYTHQVSVGYTRQFGELYSLNADVTYADGGNQHTSVDHNYPVSPEALAAGVRPFPEFARISKGLTDGEVEYRAFSLRFERRFAGDFQFTGSYTLASAENDSEGLPASHFNRDWEWGQAEADRRHRLRLSGIFRAPYDIYFSGLVNYQSSLPFNVSAGRDLNGDGIGNDRPPGITRNTGCRDLDLDAVNAYRVTNGRAAVQSIDCPDFLTFNFVVQKQFPVFGDNHLDLIFQVFNAFNRSNFLPPVGNALSALFGQSVAVADPRQMEIAARFVF